MQSRLDAAVGRLDTTRRFTKQYLGDLEPGDWFWQPAEGINNLVWHVAHVAFAQYTLCLRRVRGPRDDDEKFMPAAFFERYRRGSLPSADPAENEPIDEVLRVFDAVHAQVLAESAGWTIRQMDVPADPPPHPVFTTKLEAIEWCSAHEMTHVGQMVLLRRLMGKPAQW